VSHEKNGSTDLDVVCAVDSPPEQRVRWRSVSMYTVSQKKFTCYNVDNKIPILTIFGRNVTEKVSS